MAKKEAVYADTFRAVPKDNSRNRVVETGKSIDNGTTTASPATVLESAVETLSNGDEILFARVPIGTNRYDWKPVARYREQLIGSRAEVIGREYRGVLTARQLRALDYLFGRGPNDDTIQFVNDESWKRVEVPAVEVKLNASGRRMLQVRYRDLWFSAGVFQGSHARPAVRKDPEMEAARARGAPRLAIV